MDYVKKSSLRFIIFYKKPPKNSGAFLLWLFQTVISTMSKRAFFGFFKGIYFFASKHKKAYTLRESLCIKTTEKCKNVFSALGSIFYLV